MNRWRSTLRCARPWTWLFTTSSANAPVCRCGSCSADTGSGSRPASPSGSCRFAQTVEMAKMWFNQGFRCLKIKGGADLDADVERLLKVREELGPKVDLRFDANQGYTVEQTLDLVKRAKRARLQLIEQPTPREQTGTDGPDQQSHRDPDHGGRKPDEHAGRLPSRKERPGGHGQHQTHESRRDRGSAANQRGVPGGGFRGHGRMHGRIGALHRGRTAFRAWRDPMWCLPISMVTSG